MAIKTVFLNGVEKDLIDEIERALPHIQKIGAEIALNEKQYTIFKRICNKARNEGSDAYGIIDPDKETYQGIRVYSLAVRRRYRKADLVKLELENANGSNTK
jgi:hypothetical protein